jgi:hypothetical protein
MAAPPGPNQDIDLFRGRLRVVIGPDTYAGSGRIWLAWQAVPRLRFEVTLGFAEQVRVVFAMDRRRASARAFVTTSSITSLSAGASTRLDGFFAADVDVGAGRRLSYVTFELPNMPELSGRLSVVATRWRLTLARTGSRDLFHKLRADGGHALTATARLELDSGAMFDAPSISDVLESVRSFLSFAIGSWTEPLLITGYSASDKIVWRRWGVSRVSRWEFRSRWLPQRDHQPAIDLFAAWHARWLDPYWKEVLGRVTYFFVDAIRSFVDLGLVVAQSALETLSYAIRVIAKKSITAAAFSNPKGNPASQKIRGLLADLGLPATISATDLPALSAFVPDPAITDGPAKITYLRNRLVHPLKTVRTPGGSETYEAWRLALSYVEATLLAFLGYSGTIWNRVTNDVRPFP